MLYFFLLLLFRFQLTFETEMKVLLREFEILERGRLHHMSRTLAVVAKDSKPAIVVEANRRLDTLQRSLAAINAQHDISTFVAAHGTDYYYFL